MMNMREAFKGVRPNPAPQMDPTSQDGDTFFVPAEMMPDGKCEPGMEVMVKSRIVNKGSKVGLTPIEISYMMGDGELQQE